MARQFSDWDLIWCFLELEDLLVDELTLLVHNDERVRPALYAILADRLWAELL